MAWFLDKNKYLFSIFLITLSLSGCCVQTCQTSYDTPYGIIERGYTEEQVTKVMGEPGERLPNKNAVVWYYRFDKDNRYFVYFIDGKVIEVKKAESERL